MSSQSAGDFCATLVAGLVANGVEHAAVSPGSRNTPLLLALEANPGVRISVHHDERSAAFFALGMARVTRRPTVLNCTSGTAATEYLPALTEARMAHIPLIAITADRPPELQDRGAPQTIDQNNLYGVAAKWFHDTGVPSPESAGAAAYLAARAVATAIESPAGPVHINVPFRDPMIPDGRSGDMPHERQPIKVSPARAGTSAGATETEIRHLAELVEGRRVLILAGNISNPDGSRAIADAAAALGAIVIADPQSSFRFGGLDNRPLITAADLLIAAGFGDAAPPDVVVHVGALPTSSSVSRWLQMLDCDLAHIDDGRWRDPLGKAGAVITAEPALTLARLAKAAPSGPGDFVDRWRTADDAAIGAVEPYLESRLTEPGIGYTVAKGLPAGSLLLAGSSMPIRLIDSYGLRRSPAIRVLANRGANGIDGAIATSLGIAAAASGPTYALIGDVTALVDVASLATAARTGADVTFVVINNDGGGIFHHLPQADPDRVDPAVFEKLIAAPHGLSVTSLASAFGVAAAEARTPCELTAAIQDAPVGPRLVEVRTNRAQGPAARRTAIAAVAAVLD